MDTARRLAAQLSGVGAGGHGGARAVWCRPVAAHPDHARGLGQRFARHRGPDRRDRSFRFRRRTRFAPSATADFGAPLLRGRRGRSACRPRRTEYHLGRCAAARRFVVRAGRLRSPAIRRSRWPPARVWPLSHGEPGLLRRPRRADRRRPRLHRRRHRTGAARVRGERGVRLRSTSAAGVRWECGSCCRRWSLGR